MREKFHRAPQHHKLSRRDRIATFLLIVAAALVIIWAYFQPAAP